MSEKAGGFVIQSRLSVVCFVKNGCGLKIVKVFCRTKDKMWLSDCESGDMKTAMLHVLTAIKVLNHCG